MSNRTFPGPLSTLVDLVRWRTRHQPDQTAYIFLVDGETAEQRLSYAELDRQARAIGALLQDIGVTGERALLLYPPGLDYIAAFFGCLYAGVVAVPAYPPHPARLERTFPRLRAIAGDARPAVALTTTAILPMAELLFKQAADTQAMRWLATDNCVDDLAQVWRAPVLDAATLAFLQYTSGSTAAPKGVMLTHANLLHNLELIYGCFEHTPESHGVIWLPPYHDMGLIGGVLQPIYGGFPATLMSPVTFLQSPLRWLQAISRYRGTTSGGPNFAYDLCVRKITPEQRATLDLSSWQVAFNGAEPVHPETLERFTAAFAPCGFRKEAFYPCYGLAEATLIVSGGHVGALPIERTFQGSALDQHHVSPAGAAQEGARTLVGCGQSLPDQAIRIVHPTTLMPCVPGTVGEIWVSGPSIAQGYWERPEETERIFRASTAETHEGPFLRTGDLGFVQDGELFVTGRLKDLIIIRGRNHYPQDIELTVEQSHPGLRPGCGAAFSVEIDDEERLVVVQEVERQFRNLDVEAVAQTIRRAIAEQHELQTHAVVLIKTGSIPKTSSGKIQRHACKTGFLDSSLEVVGSSIQETLAAPATDGTFTRETLLAAAPAARRRLLEDSLGELVAQVCGVAPARLDTNQPLIAFGLDSLMGVEFQHRIETSLGVIFPMASLLEGPSIAQIADTLLAQFTADSGSMLIPAQASAAEHALSYGQRALWFLHQLAPESIAYTIASVVCMRGQLNVSALRAAFQALVDRHPALRTTFPARQGQPMQLIHEQSEVCFRQEDATRWGEEDLHRRLDEETGQPFDLEHGPLLRVTLFTRTDETHYLSLAVHHIAVDFWSLDTLMHELGQLYQAQQTGAVAPLPPLSLHYSDYVAWQNDMLAGPEGERLWGYWQHQLAGAPQTLDLPTDRLRPPLQTFHGAVERLTLSDDLARRLRALAQTEGATVYMALLAAFQVLLFRYSGQEDFLIGSPTAGRGRAQLADLVGYFVNPVALRADLSGSPSFNDVVRRVRQTVLGALKHQEYPFALLVERLQPLRDPSRSPLFQVMFALEKAQRLAPQGASVLAQGRAGARLELAGMTLEPIELDPQAAQFDLMLMVEEAGATLAATLHYNSDLFEATTIVHMARVFQSLLAQLVDQPDQPVATVPLLSEEQRRQLLVDWNTTAAPVPPVQGIHHMVAAQAARTPDAVALVVGEQRLTYRELDQRVNRLARHLQRLGVGPDGLVGICMDRSADLVLALLAVLKAGGAYVPLDPAYPAERLQQMLEDSQPRVVLVATTDDRPPTSGHRPPTTVYGGPATDDGLRTVIATEGSEPDLPLISDPFSFARGRLWSVVDLIADWPTIAQELDTAPDSGVTLDNLAYVIYTSGSTGRPKGVAITHGNAAALIQWAHLFFAPEELAGVLASTSICFDLSIFELFVPLSRGGTVIMCENLLRLPALPAVRQVTLINTVPSAMAELLRFGDLPPTVCTVNLAGEPLPNRLAQQIYQQPTVQRVLNLYGPSEDTTYSTVALVERGADVMPPIGWPIANTQVYLLDAQLQPVPVGVPGEIYIGGSGLARGYLNQPALTAERFIPDPFSKTPNARLYRTGDLARFRPDGTIEYLRRVDHQVKIRGYRIELGEIEALLSRHPAVSEAAVVAREDVPGDKRLVAYIVPKAEGGRMRDEGAIDRTASSALLRAWLHNRLPNYMVPSAFVALDCMPLTPNGKLDRRALPPPDQSRPALTQGYVAPGTPVEEVLAGIWASVLGLDRVGVNDNFFELGGHSLLATQVLARVRESFRAELPLHSLFEEPTVARLAQTIEQLRNESNERASSSIHARPRGSNRREQLLAQIAQLSEQEASQLLREKKGVQHP